MFSFVLAAAAEEQKHHLPLPTWGYPLIAAAFFFVLFLVTWSFRSAGTKH